MRRSYLVESIPDDLVGIGLSPWAESTGSVLVRLTAAATQAIRITVMYWSLTPDPTSADESGFTVEKLQKLGATQGEALLAALREAAGRGVKISIVQGSGSNFGPNPDLDKLKADFPSVVDVAKLDVSAWFGGGIMHQKTWIFDDRALYVGSANMDWRSLAQVKEMGVVFEDVAEFAGDAKRQFEVLWRLASLSPKTKIAWDPEVRISRPVPPWSELIPPDDRTESPFADAPFATKFNREHPLRLDLDGLPGEFYMSAGPSEARGAGRTDDKHALASTIDDARRSVCVSVMDFAPTGLYARPPDSRIDEPASLLSAPVWWPTLWSALLRAASTRRCWVRVLVSKWAHSSGVIEPYLQALKLAADAACADPYITGGSLEVKLFTMPGWDSTRGPSRRYPDHTRVNHAKYIVTDRRANIGTSNMTWDYFAQTAGTSVNTNHPGLVGQLQAAFDRDWTSRYAVRV